MTGSDTSRLLLTSVMRFLQGVHRSSSIASSGVLSTANRVNSDSSDKLAEAAAALKDMQAASASASASSYTERNRVGRVRSAEIIPEFAPVREVSSGEKSDMCSAVNDSVDPSSWSSQDLSGTADCIQPVSMLPDRKVAELKLAGKSGGQSAMKSGSRTTAHVGFV